MTCIVLFYCYVYGFISEKRIILEKKEEILERIRKIFTKSRKILEKTRLNTLCFFPHTRKLWPFFLKLFFLLSLQQIVVVMLRF